MPRPLVTRSAKDIEEVRALGDHRDSRKAAWKAIRAGSEVIREIQHLGARRKRLTTLGDAEPFLDENAKTILRMRLEALGRLKQAPHHQDGYRLSKATGARHPRAVSALCLISGFKGQEIPGLVAFDRVVVDVEHMEQALGPASVTEIVEIRRAIGEYVYISTNVSETPQLVRNPKDGTLDTRPRAARPDHQAAACRAPRPRVRARRPTKQGDAEAREEVTYGTRAHEILRLAHARAPGIQLARGG